MKDCVRRVAFRMDIKPEQISCDKCVEDGQTFGTLRIISPVHIAQIEKNVF